MRKVKQIFWGMLPAIWWRGLRAASRDKVNDNFLSSLRESYPGRGSSVLGGGSRPSYFGGVNERERGIMLIIALCLYEGNAT